MAVLKRLLRSGGICEGAEILRFAQDDNVDRMTRARGIGAPGDSGTARRSFASLRLTMLTG